MNKFFDSNTDGRFFRWLLVLFLLAAGLRVGWVTVRFAGGQRWAAFQYPDEQAYCQVADSLAAGEGMVDEFGYRATYMPAYPAFIALFRALPQPLFWARITQALLGALAAPATFLLAGRWLRISRARRAELQPGWSNQRVAALAAVAVACDPFLIFFSGLLLTETLFTAALITLWVFVLPMSEAGVRLRVWPVVLAGVLLWVCLMLRPAAAIPHTFDPRRIVSAKRRVTGMCLGLPVVPLVRENISTSCPGGRRAVVCPSKTRSIYGRRSS